MIFLTKKTLIFAIAVTLFFAIVFVDAFAAVKTASMPHTPLGKTVVIDAGHGGIDGGVVGVNGSVEAKINLALSKQLGEILSHNGITVVYTRDTDAALSDIKREDMKKREEIIKSSGADCVVSIHLNSYSDSKRRGVQVFYGDNGNGESLAAHMQLSLNAKINSKYCKRTDFQPQKGDYYIAKCSNIPSVIIECGFISNEEDERLLNTPSYKTELCNAIAKAIIVAIA